MPDKISILKESGETLNSNVVSVFMIPDTEKKYIITTENAVDPHGLTVLHVSEIVDGNLQKVATDDEWSAIKTIMRAIISGNVGTYQYLPSIESIKADGQYSRDISVSASASKQMIDNYAIADKSIVANNANLVAESSVEVQPEVPVVPQSSTIFPTNDVVTNEDNEVIPGIAEVPNNAPAVASPSVVETPVGSDASVLEPSVSVVTPVVPEISVAAPVENTNPISLEQSNMLNNTNVVSSSNVEQVEVVPGVINNTGVNNELNSSSVMVPPIVNNPIDNNVSIVSNVPTNIEVQPVPVIVSEPVEAVNVDVQVVPPTQVVPTAQIVLEEQQNNVSSINFNAVPNFAPSSTLDEVVVGAQEMFMEGVKNLVETIQEKIYRDLYNKEMELKQRESLLLQKEQMINGQGNVLTTNLATQPSLGTESPVQVISTPVITQPTMVEAANDVI